MSTNDGKAGELANAILAMHPRGGVVVILIEESPVRGDTHGLIACDGAFRIGEFFTASGGEAIGNLGVEIGKAAREAIHRVTAELGGAVDKSTASPRLDES